MIGVKRQEGESIDKLLNRFKNKVKDSHILDKYKECLHFVSKSSKKRNKKDLSIRKQKKLQLNRE